jgi:hypothetical protein
VVSIGSYLTAHGWCTWVLYMSTSVGGEIEWLEKGGRVLVLCVIFSFRYLTHPTEEKSVAFLAG